jgi:hypothetical protein
VVVWACKNGQLPQEGVAVRCGKLSKYQCATDPFLYLEQDVDGHKHHNCSEAKFEIIHVSWTTEETLAREILAMHSYRGTFNRNIQFRSSELPLAQAPASDHREW